MYSNAVAIIDRIRTTLTAPVQGLVPGMSLNLDEPLSLVYSDLPALAIYPIKEDLLPDESFTQDKKSLSLRIELRMKSGPASTICTPVINTVCAALKADRTLGGLAVYVEIQSLQWANDNSESGVVCGASIDLVVFYLI
jgi:hypothetical protein